MKIRKKTTSRQQKRDAREQQRKLEAVTEWVRLKQDEALELHTLAAAHGLPAAERHLQMLRPTMSPEDVHEVAWRCEDPRSRGGVRTGFEAGVGTYADVALTRDL